MSYEKFGRDYIITSSQTTSASQSQSQPQLQSQSQSQSQYQTQQPVPNCPQLNDAQNRQLIPKHLNEFDIHPDIEPPAHKYYNNVNALISPKPETSNRIISYSNVPLSFRSLQSLIFSIGLINSLFDYFCCFFRIDMCIKKSPFPLFQLVVLGQKLHLRKLKLCICQPKCTKQMSNVTSCKIWNNLDRMLKTGPRDYSSLKKLVPRESKKCTQKNEAIRC